MKKNNKKAHDDALIVFEAWLAIKLELYKRSLKSPSPSVLKKK